MYLSSSTGWRTRCARTPAFLRASSNRVKAPSHVCRSVIGCSICSVAICAPSSVDTNARQHMLKVRLDSRPFSPASRVLDPSQHRRATPKRGMRGDQADDGSRTRDLELGKLALYQLSYVRSQAVILGGDFHGASLPF